MVIVVAVSSTPMLTLLGGIHIDQKHQIAVFSAVYEKRPAARVSLLHVYCTSLYTARFGHILSADSTMWCDRADLGG